MPVKIVAGKNKYGNERVFHLPSKLLDAKGRVSWEEWQVKNGYRDRQAADLFAASGRKLNAEHFGVVLGPNGKPIPLIIVEMFTASEIKEALARVRAEQDKRGVNWSTRRLRVGGATLAQIEIISRNQNLVEADKVILVVKKMLNDPFFGPALMGGKLVIPEKEGLNTKIIKELAEDFFFKAYKAEKEQRQKQYAEAEAKTLRQGKDVLPASKWSKVRQK